MSNNEQQSFVRWQGITIKQLSFVNNLLIGLATGMLAFHTQLAFDDKSSVTAVDKWLVVLSIVFLFLSLAIGCYLALNRLCSFRITAQVARKRETDARERIEELRTVARKLDERTWRLLAGQTILFALGGLPLVIASVIRYLR